MYIEKLYLHLHSDIMNKLASLLVVGLVSLLMSSCFLFRTHEDCPAYGNLEQKDMEKENIDNKEALLILKEDKS